MKYFFMLLLLCSCADTKSLTSREHYDVTLSDGESFTCDGAQSQNCGWALWNCNGNSSQYSCVTDASIKQDP